MKVRNGVSLRDGFGVLPSEPSQPSVFTVGVLRSDSRSAGTSFSVMRAGSRSGALTLCIAVHVDQWLSNNTKSQYTVRTAANLSWCVVVGLET